MREWGLLVAIFVMVGLSASLHAQEYPDSYALAAEDSFSWKAESRILVDWEGDRPIKTGLKCVARHDRNLQGGKPPLEITLMHPIESGDYRFGLHFNLPDTDLINRNVETITIGGRPYQREIVPSRIIGFTKPEDIILAYGIGRQMFRSNETYPWLPIEFLVPQFIEVEGIELGISGDFEVEHGEYERRYEAIYIDMDGFKEILRWCYEQVNPTADSETGLPPELIERLEQ